jgi:mannan endo-1,4-beta-mannosidase
MGVEKWLAISTGTVLTVASAVAGGSALADTFKGSPGTTVSALARPSPRVTPTAMPSPAGTPSAMPSAAAMPTGTPTPAGSPAPTGSPSPADSPTSAPTPAPASSGTPVATPSPSPTTSPAQTPLPAFTFGWYPAGSSAFNAAVIDALPVKPQVVNYYSGWNEPFNTSFAQAAYADGIQTFVEMEPWNCGTCADGTVPEMTDIAAGGYDGYLTSFGQAIKAFGHPVLVTFAHEMNGGWYPWGYGGSEQTTPAQWIAAWDHVVTVINAQASGLVTWIWAPNVEIGATSVAQYWPGAGYVGEVGLDGYLASDDDTYQSEFGQTVTDVRAITGLPIWITETGVNQDDSTGDRLVALATDVKQAGLTGILYFDEGSAVLTVEEEQMLADVIGPWLTFLPTPSSAPALAPSSAPTLAPATTPPPTPSPTCTSPTPAIPPATPTTSARAAYVTHWLLRSYECPDGLRFGGSRRCAVLAPGRLDAERIIALSRLCR